MTIAQKLSVLAVAAASVFAALSLPASAAAQHVIPPGNPAANQYTETYGTVEGDSISSASDEGRSPQDALGGANARHLEEAGPEGERAAHLAAETSDSSAPGRAVNDESDAERKQGSTQQNHSEGPPKESELNQESGSSGAGLVAGQATGISGSLGVPALLVMIAIGLGSISILWRRFRPEA